MSVGSLMTATSKPRTKTGKHRVIARHFDPVIVEHIGTNGQINVHVVNLRAKKKRFAKPVSVYFRICVIALTNANKTRLDVIGAWPSAAELSMGWVDPWVALGWIGSHKMDPWTAGLWVLRTGPEGLAFLQILACSAH